MMPPYSPFSPLAAIRARATCNNAGRHGLVTIVRVLSSRGPVR